FFARQSSDLFFDRAALDIGATMGHQVRLQKARSGLPPLLEGADWDLLLEQSTRSHRGGAALTPLRWERRRRSAVAALIERSWLRHSSVSWRCSCRSSASTSVGRKGMRRLAQIRLAACQTRNSACWTSGPYVRSCERPCLCWTSSAWLSSHLA